MPAWLHAAGVTLLAAVALIYVTYAGRGFFNGSLVAVAIKTSVAYLTAYLSFLFVMMVFVLVYVLVALVPTSSGVDWDLVTATDYEVIEVIDTLVNVLEGVRDVIPLP